MKQVSALIGSASQKFLLETDNGGDAFVCADSKLGVRATIWGGAQFFGCSLRRVL